MMARKKMIDALSTPVRVQVAPGVDLEALVDALRRWNEMTPELTPAEISALVKAKLQEPSDG